MKLQRVLVALTVVNVALLAVLLGRARSVEERDRPGTLRGRGLEIVDDAGKVRASIQVLPPTTTPEGKPYPETVILRLVTRDGRPSVKLSASERGGILVLGGASDPTYLQAKAEGGDPSITLSAKDGRRKVVEP